MSENYDWKKLPVLDFPHFSLSGVRRRKIIAKQYGCWRLCSVLPSRRGSRALPDSAGICEIRIGFRLTPRAMPARIPCHSTRAVKYALPEKEVASLR